jgi:hypothetical protein
MRLQVVKPVVVFYHKIPYPVSQGIGWLGLQPAMVDVKDFIEPAGDVKAKGIHI